MSFYRAQQARKPRGSFRRPHVIDEPMIREILMSRLVRKEPIKSISERIGVGYGAVWSLISGRTHEEARSRCIRELRAEGHVVDLTLAGMR